MEDLAGGDVQLADDGGEHRLVDVVLDLQAHGGTSHLASQQLLLQRVEKVFGVVLLHLDVLVAGDAEGGVVQHLHACEQLPEVPGDDLLQGHEAPLREFHES